MSLSKTIIYGTEQEVASLLVLRPKLDVIDEYGYTPLIQTAIINSIPKAKLLLDAGASIDFPDLTGRTALFWAADNNNIDLCNLCLKYHANPNAYSSGGQPLLVMPLMKSDQEIKSLLIENGAKIDFAQDFLNAKLIGHGFELEGRVDIVDTENVFIEIELEGFYLRFTVEVVAHSLRDFRYSFAAKKLRKFFPIIDRIISSLKAATELIRLQHYLIDIKHFLDKINALLNTQPLILPISFGGHAITLCKYQDMLVRCDRGQFGNENGTVIYYNIENKALFTKALARDLIYKRQYPEYINSGLISELGLVPKRTLALPTQKTGNCSWANVEAVIPALMFPMLLEERGYNKVESSEKDALNFYHEWREWNNTRSLDFCIQSLTERPRASQCAKAALLSAILFQSCDHQNPHDRSKANKILTILSEPDYLPLLKAYAKTFSKEPDSPLWQNFINYLEECGINIERLI
jgi:hypothetical protein